MFGSGGQYFDVDVLLNVENGLEHIKKTHSLFAPILSMMLIITLVFVGNGSKNLKKELFHTGKHLQLKRAFWRSTTIYTISVLLVKVGAILCHVARVRAKKTYTVIAG